MKRIASAVLLSLVVVFAGGSQPQSSSYDRALAAAHAYDLQHGTHIELRVAEIKAEMAAETFGCQGDCEADMWETLVTCLENGGGEWCSWASHALFCFCMSECDPPLPYPSCE